MTDLLACVVRDSYGKLTLDVAMIYLVADLLNLEHGRFQDPSPGFGMMLLHDLVRSAEDSRRASEMADSPLAKKIAAGYPIDDYEVYFRERGPDFVSSMKMVGNANVPMTVAKWGEIMDATNAMLARSSGRRPKAQSLEEQWDKRFGDLPRVRYELVLADTTWLRAIKKGTWFLSAAFDPAH